MHDGGREPVTADLPAGPRPLTMTEAAIPIVALIGLVGLSFFLFGGAGAKGPNQVALVLAATVGSTVTSAPCTFFNILSPLISVALAFLGVRMLRPPSPGSSSGS
jgi:hypothetical protein